MRLRWLPRLIIFAVSITALKAEQYSFKNTQLFLKTYCATCHQSSISAGGFNLDQVADPASLQSDQQRWISINLRVRNGEMPPKGSSAPTLDHRAEFNEWIRSTLRAAACADGIVPGAAPIRRLNRDQYTATIRDLLDLHMDIGHALPADGAGGEGFDNAAETLFLSPLHSEKYMELAGFATDFAAKEYKSRAKILVAKPGPGVSQNQAAHQILAAFLPRAFRRPLSEAEIQPYMALFEAARKNGQDFEPAIFFAVRGALVSPLFLFRTEAPNTSPNPRLVEEFAFASRLSYFLWDSMPDELLFDTAAAGKLHDPEVLSQTIQRMLRSDRARNFVQSFVDQWLRVRELAIDKAPDAKLFPSYAEDEELRSDIRLQPSLFFREIIARNLSLLNLIDSKFTVGTNTLAKHMGVSLPLKQNSAKQPQWVALPEGSHRGGLLGMPAVLAVSSYPYRTSPVLRGAWVLDSIMGTPPPPPPANVPALEEIKDGAAPKTVRERLTQHRANPVCASCHSRIDPLGFALENFDAIGRWRDQEAGKPVDSFAQLIDGTTIQGPDQLKTVLLDQKDLFITNLTSKMLGYALGRGLTLRDSCTVDNIVAQLKANDYKAQTLIQAIASSVPFQYQAGIVGAKRKEVQHP